MFKKTALAAASVLLLPVTALMPAAHAETAAPARPLALADTPATYTNPVSSTFADTFADPVILRGHDGLWYAYGTSDPLKEGEGRHHRIPVASSPDLVNWTHAADALEGVALPPYIQPTSFLWAPDVRYTAGRYVMYVTATDTTTSADTWDPAIAVATAPSPTGPWTFADQPAVPPQPASGGGYDWTIDPAQFTDTDGRKYLYWGSYGGGIRATRLTADGLRATGERVQIAKNDRFEGGYVVRHGDWYYFFGSSANCCAGPTTGYAVSTGRSKSPLGPFTDRDGVRLDAPRPGGTPVVAQNGNAWVGPGHNGTFTDLSGQDWLVYHALDRADPYLDRPYEINERPMLIDRLDWIDGWPTVRAGRGPSEGPQPAPVTRGTVYDDFASGGLDGWREPGAGWTAADSALRYTGGGADLLARDVPPGDRRVEADLRGAGGLVAADGVRVVLDGGSLVARAGGSVARAPLPADFDAGDWHNLAVQIRGRELTATVTGLRQGDPEAELRLRLPAAAQGRVGVTATGDASFDNVSAARLFRPVERADGVPQPGTLVAAEEFEGSAPGAGWEWVRQDPAATVAGGRLNWPVQGSDLVGTTNTAGVLLRDAPEGPYLVETKLTLDLGDDTNRNYQQAGLIVHASDDDFARFDQVAIGDTRQLEFARELPYEGRLAFGGNQFGTPGTTTYLRLAHTVDPVNGEHEYRAGASRDGKTWVWSAVWTFPAGEQPRIGLVSQGGASPAVTAEFDYLRFYRLRG